MVFRMERKELNERFIKISYKLEENSISVNYIPFEYIHLKEVNNSIILVDNEPSYENELVKEKFFFLPDEPFRARKQELPYPLL